MANKQTRSLAKESSKINRSNRKNGNGTISLFTHTEYGAHPNNKKKHVVTVSEHRHGKFHARKTLAA